MKTKYAIVAIMVPTAIGVLWMVFEHLANRIEDHTEQTQKDIGKLNLAVTDMEQKIESVSQNLETHINNPTPTPPPTLTPTPTAIPTVTPDPQQEALRTMYRIINEEECERFQQEFLGTADDEEERALMRALLENETAFILLIEAVAEFEVQTALMLHATESEMRELLCEQES